MQSLTLLIVKRNETLNDFINKVNDVLSKCSFDAEAHGEGALGMLEATIQPPVDIDLSRIKDELADGKEIYKRLNTKRIFVGQKKAALATKLDNDPETSFAQTLVVVPSQKKDENQMDKNANKDIVIEDNKEDQQIDELKLSDDELKRIGNEMFKIGFRPSRENIQNELAAVNGISRLLRNNPAASDEAKRIFNANRNKITLMKSAVGDPDSMNDIEEKFRIIDQVLTSEFNGKKEYKPTTVEQLKWRESTAIDLQN